jgi:hypothetical protein
VPSDIDNTSPIELDDNPAVRSRVVYNVARVPEDRMQVGIINVSYGHVAVWRPYDPDDDRWDASWQNAAWRNVYSTVIPLDQPATTARGKAYKTFALKAFERDGVVAQLPRAELRMTNRLQMYLQSVRAAATSQCE